MTAAHLPSSVRRFAGQTALFLRAVLAVVAVLLASVVTPPEAVAAPEPTPAAADEQPVNCKMGVFLISLSRIDTAAGTFSADLWAWSVCPDKDTTPLMSLEFPNGVDVKGTLDSTEQRGKVWWSTRKFSGTFRQEFALQNYPFDHQTLTILAEEASLDTRSLTYTADTADSKIDEGLSIPSWKIDGFGISSGDKAYQTNFGDPSLADAESNYARMVVKTDIGRRSPVSDFLKSTLAVYIAALLALISLLTFEGRPGLLGATMFTVVLSFVSLDRLIGQHDGIFLLDKVHFAALAVIMSAGACGVYSLRAIALGADKDRQHIRDKWAAIVLFAGFVLANVLIFVSALRGG